MQPLFLKPIFKERIWGGTSLHDEFGYDIPKGRIGECWAISAHPNGASVVENGEYAGVTLDALWKEHPELFGNPKEEVFPLLTKILDANMDLSVQVHPDDVYAKIHENGELGKTECWYILDCKENAEMIFGHKAYSREELMYFIKEGKWEDLLGRVKIKPGDFFFVPSGTIHALCEGTLVLETQQSSDTTYRVYDYERVDDGGNRRELHLEKAIEVTTVPHKAETITPVTHQENGAKITTYIESSFFSVYKWEIETTASFKSYNQYLLCSVINGEGSLVKDGETYLLGKGDHFILPVNFGVFEMKGPIEVLVSQP
ncbi:mannose-6-phosphate isomerase, class I [Robertmurraya sp. GLU-23]